MEEAKRMTVILDDGQEREVSLHLTFDAGGKKFALFSDVEHPEDGVYAYRYDEDGNMECVTDEKDLQMCEEVLGAFTSEEDEDDES